jgi:hypothetical protein
LLRDYHTILNTLKADGKPNENAVQSYRSYLIEAEFSILLSAKSEDLLIKIKSALINPEWPVFLGRKSCSPSLPVYWGEEIEAENVKLGFEKLTLIGNERKKKFPVWFKKGTDKQELFACITDEKIKNSDTKKSLIRDNIMNSRLRVFSLRETYKFFVKVNV